MKLSLDEDAQPSEEASEGSLGPFHTLDKHGALCFMNVIKGDLASVLAISA